MAQASGLSLRLVWDEIPLLAGAAGCVAAGSVPGGGRRNREFFGARVRTTRSLDEAQQALLYDPQTSGGLFVAVAAGRVEEIVAAFRQADEPVWVIGEAVAGEAGLLEIA
jgi:selenide,water dikinase